MGYTHYWTHSARFTADEWRTVREDVNAILTTAAESGVVLGATCGTAPMTAFNFIEGNDSVIGFNGLGDDSHETFMIYQKRKPLESWQDASRSGWDFCKTARKPYDVAVTACLVYLESYFPKKFSVSSDGNSSDWQAGLTLAKLALPRLANALQIPAEIDFDSQFKSRPICGDRLFIAETTAGEIVVADHKRHTILARFPAGEIAKDVATRVLKVMERDPARAGWVNSAIITRWADKECKYLLQNAPLWGGVVTEPA